MCRLSQVPKANLSNNDEFERLHPIGPSDTPPQPSVCQWLCSLLTVWEWNARHRFVQQVSQRPSANRSHLLHKSSLPTRPSPRVRRSNNIGKKTKCFPSPLLHNSVARPHRLVASFQDATIGLSEPPSHVVWATLQHRETKLEQFLQVHFIHD